MSRLVLYSGATGNFAGAYDWVAEKDYDDPTFSVGPHNESAWPEDWYTVVEVVDETARAQDQREVERLRAVEKAARDLLDHPDEIIEIDEDGVVLDRRKNLRDALTRAEGE